MAGSQQMHPLSAETTAAPVELDVLVMLKRYTETRMAGRGKMCWEREESRYRGDLED